jgi:hypothetical protein
MNSFGYRPWREAIALKSRIGVTDQPMPNKSKMLAAGMEHWLPLFHGGLDARLWP